MTGASDEIASPCTDVCVIDPVTGWCRGCQRTIFEITAWPSLSNDEKQEILAELDHRAARR